MEIQPEKKRTRKDHTGEPVFPGTGPFSLFSGLLIYFLLYIEIEYKVMQGQQT